VGQTFATARRRGKFLWLETEDGPVLGLHLGMAGRIVVDDGDDVSRWDRFAVEFEDGTRFALRDKRRLGRAVLDPDFSHVGPDAADVGRDEFRRLVGSGNTAVKARLLNQHAISGVGNLLADEALWKAAIDPNRPANALAEAELDRLRNAIRSANRSAIAKGGVHTGRFIPARTRDGVCPRCGTPLSRSAIGGRTTYWCPAEQR
jgi:formamidopyrimidine-DNA glycosylase